MSANQERTLQAVFRALGRIYVNIDMNDSPFFRPVWNFSILPTANSQELSGHRLSPSGS